MGSNLMAVDINTNYLSKITWEHREKPKYEATISASIQPIAEITEFLRTLYQDFDLDTAIGVQLDAVGVRIGRDRFIDIPLQYFSVEVEGLGVNEGLLKGPNDPLFGKQPLADEPYRHLLYAVVMNNHWNGSIPNAYACYDFLFGPNNYVLIQDYGNMSMAVVLYGTTPTTANMTFYTREQIIALFTTDNLKLRPAGVKQYFLMRDSDFPLGIGSGGPPAFGIGVDNDNISGVGEGHILEVVNVE